MSDSARLQTVLAGIDAYNAQDPNHYEKPYSERLTGWVLKLNPQASEWLRIVARGQHIGRWTSPRDRYPMDRGGYLRWREDLKRFHANTVTEMMAKAGYSAEEQERVRTIILKKNPLNDPDVQTVEDALCLVFLETQFDDLLEKTPEEKMIEIVRKTWKKMSDKGRQAALGLLLTSRQRTLVEKALAV